MKKIKTYKGKILRKEGEGGNLVLKPHKILSVRFSRRRLRHVLDQFIRMPVRQDGNRNAVHVGGDMRGLCEEKSC